MTAVGALFDSSKQLINGHTNAISIAVLSALIPFAENEKVAMAVLFALLVGLIQTGITLFRREFFFIVSPVPVRSQDRRSTSMPAL